MIKINEVFLSAQGEGPDVGVPTVFLRLSGCNVACKWCDTLYANEVKEILSVGVIANRVVDIDRYYSKRVYITGGEPLTQLEEVSQLVRSLVCKGYMCTIATNGTLPAPTWWRTVTWDVDMKCPSSGVSAFDRSWTVTGRKNRIKFVVADRHDLAFVLKTLSGLTGSDVPTLVVSPMIPQISVDNLSHPIVEMALMRNNWLQEVWHFGIQYNLRYSLQIHKVIFGAKKGV
jgi:7-carboxy-7-deazaguanine synthase